MLNRPNRPNRPNMNDPLKPLTIGGKVEMKTPLVLAPLAGHTDRAFRGLVRDLGGCGLVVTEMVSWATGGPQVYTGRSMIESHAHLNITEREWQAMVADFQATLDHFEVPSQEQGELIAIVESTKADIVKAESL